MVPEIRLLEAIQAVVPGVTAIAEVGTFGDPATVKVDPANLQALAQPVINNFKWSADEHARWLEAKRPGRKALQQMLTAELAANTAYLARANPSIAENQAQIRRLTQQVTALLKLD